MGTLYILLAASCISLCIGCVRGMWKRFPAKRLCLSLSWNLTFHHCDASHRAVRGDTALAALHDTSTGLKSQLDPAKGGEDKGEIRNKHIWKVLVFSADCIKENEMFSKDIFKVCFH